MALVTPVSTTTFHNSIGVNTHLHYTDTLYADWPRVVGLLSSIGIKRIRDGGFYSPDPAWQGEVDERIAYAGARGIRFLFMIGQDLTSLLTAARISQIVTKYRGLAIGVEGRNEADRFSDYGSSNWGAANRAWLQQTFPRVRAQPSLNLIPMVAPSTTVAPTVQFGNVTSWIDRANWHPYRGGNPPNQQAITDHRTMYQPAFGSDTVWVTEAGFHTATSASAPPHQPPVSEAVQANYTIKTYLEHWVGGVPMTFIYQFLDHYADPTRTDAEAYFGLIRSNYTMKPAAVALKNFIARLGPSGSPNLRPLEFTISDPTIKSLLLRRTDNHYLLILWRSDSVWNPTTRTPITVTPVGVLVQIPNAQYVWSSKPTVSATETQLAFPPGGSILLGVGGDPVVLRIVTPWAIP